MNTPFLVIVVLFTYTILKKERDRWLGKGTASTIFWHIQYLTSAVPLQIIYLSQTLFQLA